MELKEFKRQIWEYYKAALDDCQIPTGAIAHLNAAEYYAYCLKLENDDLRKKLEKQRKDN